MKGNVFLERIDEIYALIGTDLFPETPGLQPTDEAIAIDIFIQQNELDLGDAEVRRQRMEFLDMLDWYQDQYNTKEMFETKGERYLLWLKGQSSAE